MSKKKTDNKELGEVRADIDRLDQEIQALISERARLALRVRESKEGSSQAVDYSCLLAWPSRSH